MNPPVDVLLTCKVIREILNSTKNTDIDCILTFTNIKVLCDVIEAQTISENLWNPYLQEKLLEILNACAYDSKMYDHSGTLTPIMLANTALDSFESAYLSKQ